ncbi:hypothetical protein [Haladaptatus sp. DYF46]|uniref:hypothetical protein n=1 Tax=Haladaptatus sp. DYF46 TaxID=2886041 RepID=UPI001E3D7FCD|nr:hypothetical protein [Haladaptatus sp. DYF46]
MGWFDRSGGTHVPCEESGDRCEQRNGGVPRVTGFTIDVVSRPAELYHSVVVASDHPTVVNSAGRPSSFEDIDVLSRRCTFHHEIGFFLEKNKKQRNDGGE